MNAVNIPADADDIATRRHPPMSVLLERARRRLYDQATQRFHAGGFTDLRLAHSAVLAFLPPGGARLTLLAQRARVTKQSMGELVRELERLSYVQRLPDPTDRRAKIVTVTQRGRTASRAGVRALKAVEEDWACDIGVDRMNELRAILEELTGAAETG